MRCCIDLSLKDIIQGAVALCPLATYLRCQIDGAIIFLYDEDDHAWRSKAYMLWVQVASGLSDTDLTDESKRNQESTPCSIRYFGFWYPKSKSYDPLIGRTGLEVNISFSVTHGDSPISCFLVTMNTSIG